MALKLHDVALHQRGCESFAHLVGGPSFNSSSPRFSSLPWSMLLFLRLSLHSRQYLSLHPAVNLELHSPHRP